MNLNGSLQQYLLGPGLLAGTLLVALAITRRKRRQSDQPPWPKVPGALPVVGNSIGKVEDLCVRIEEWAEKYGKERGIFEFNLFGIRYIVCCTDEIASELESQRPYNMQRIPQLNEAVKSIGADGLFAAEGEVWKKDRRLVVPSLNRKNVKDYVAAVKVVSQRLVDTLESHGYNNAIAVNNHILSSTVDIISLVAFDRDIDCVRKGKNEIGSDLQAVFRISQVRILSPVAYWNIPIVGQYLDGAGWAVKRLEASFSDLVKENESSPDISEAKTFLSKVISLSKSNNSDNRMSHKRLIGNLMTMFAAGSETTHVTICSSLWEIATDTTGLQDELAAEALAVEDFGGAGLDEITNSLPRLRSLVYEVLRIKGPSPFLGLQNMQELELSGTVLPPHTFFFFPWRYISTLDDADPSRLIPLGPNNASRKDFCARRWLTEEEEGSKNVSVQQPTHKNGWRPFGVGMRVCPGRDLAEIEMLVIIASILRKFEISLEENHAPMKLVTRFTESPNIDIRLMLKPREA